MSDINTKSTQAYIAEQIAQNNMPETIKIDTITALMGIAVILVGIGVAWGTLKSSLIHITKELDIDIKPALKDLKADLVLLKERFILVEDRVKILWEDRTAPAKSPRQLNDKGINILNESGIKEIIDEKKAILLKIIQNKKPATPYDAEKLILETVATLLNIFPKLTDVLKTGAFNTGESIDSILFVGGIYLRNSIFEDLGFSIKELA